MSEHEPGPIEELKAQLEELDEQPQPPPDADPNSAGSIVAHLDDIINQAGTIKKLLYGGQAASVIRNDIGARLAQMERDLNVARSANNRLAPGTVYPADWRRQRDT
jgi:hypothetical protein